MCPLQAPSLATYALPEKQLLKLTPRTIRTRFNIFKIPLYYLLFSAVMEKKEARRDFLVYLVSAVWSAFCGICAYDMNDDEMLILLR